MEKEVERSKTAEVTSDPVVVADVGHSDEKAKKTDKAPKDVSQTKSKGIFVLCGSFKKL